MKKLLSFVTTLFFAITTFAQVDEATITVIGTGIDEERATLQALRSAIEQTFGAFVSANTTILNDSLVQDEIVSVSTGNVKEYKKIAVAALPNGHVSVSLTATVSINKLMAFAESKGVKAEFAGSIYAANIKLLRLKVESIQKAYELMVQQLEHMTENMFDFLFEMSEPQRHQNKIFGDIYYFTCRIGIVSNIVSANFSELFSKTIEELKLSEEEIKLCEQDGIELVSYRFEYDFVTRNPSDPIVLPIPYHSMYTHFEERINNAICKACHRYCIQEIGNPNNCYTYRKKEDFGYSNDDTFYYVTGESTRLESTAYINYPYWLYSAKWQLPLSRLENRYFGPCRDLRPGWVSLNMRPEGHGDFLNRGRKPFFTQLTLEMNDSVAYSKSNLIGLHVVRVAIPANTIEHFQGFELVKVSTPMYPLSESSQHAWEGEYRAVFERYIR